ncbi:Lrp/AsnC family transcriptional regulator [Hyphococcus sp.]|jgi:Lrp/AsnC family leucine-responsive transcriptional regulator|uniref:Lrp/AsnC family transcriptional regulator n=1 Tax=Hyphococcus sp. TaxID=2038636 RepID=UPI003D0FA0B5
MGKLDEANIKILSLMQEDAALTADEIAEEVGLSASAVQKRLRQMRADGVIERETAIVSAEALGGVSMFLVNIQLIRTKHDTIGAFRALMRDTEEVLQCFHITGPFDFCVLVAAKDTRAYEGFSNRMFTEENFVARFETSVVLKSVKYGFALPLEQLLAR